MRGQSRRIAHSEMWSMPWRTTSRDRSSSVSRSGTVFQKATVPREAPVMPVASAAGSAEAEGTAAAAEPLAVGGRPITAPAGAGSFSPSKCCMACATREPRRCCCWKQGLPQSAGESPALFVTKGWVGGW
jgi:hypothetical protein